MSSNAAAGTAVTGGAGSMNPQASVAQKGSQQHHKRTRTDSKGEQVEHQWSNYYVNTHIRRTGYSLPSSSSTPSSTRSSDQPNTDSSWDSDEDEGLDDEQGAEWEEWSFEQKSDYIEKEVKSLIPCIRANYVLPTAGRVNNQGDSSVFEGYGGIAYMYFHSFYKILSGLPANKPNPSTSTSTPSAKARRVGESPGHSVRNLTVPMTSPSSGDAPPASPRSAGLMAEQQLHVQRQYAISLLQEAYDYILYTLALIQKQHDEATDPQSHLSDEDRSGIQSEAKRCSFIRSKAGALALASVIFHHRAHYLILHPSTTPNVASPHFDPSESLKRRGECVEELLEMESGVVDVKGQDDEFFNGRAGYLFALNFVHSHLMEEVERMERGDSAGVGGQGREGDGGGDRSLVDNKDDSKAQPSVNDEKELMGKDGLKELLSRVKEVIATVHNAIIKNGSGSGLMSMLHSTTVLSYKWHDKEYLGGAHGTVGILHQLLQSPRSILEPTLPVILSTADHLLSLRFDSGNFPSSTGSHSDRLVQWCHGAPCLSLLCSRLYSVTHDQKWLTAAVDTSEVVWRRGLLKKGVGLCHGIAGNGYTFLALYRLTGDEVHLARAYHFGHFCFTQHRDRLFAQPDAPYSLYNGQAGLVCYGVDMGQAKKVDPSFPGYDLMNARETLEQK